ncbi:hypothetical protein Cylst_3398 [Cylindrospermum stagnale PCC 7417]|uniref:Uncharacterized protein n=1 Tax=Cylindrospermum stagnale PCC 7417 TaxID=56107 RepID=K9WZA9_9NOST|nr:hypothetical protein [Cylindrospermum stagnale]AFZ25548.1 hypothetical protein Cylst_3398 [Cylindrospermum stagnale PCC 7417]
MTSDKREVIESKIQYLHNLAGVDAKGNIYPRIYDGIVRLSPTGEVEWKQEIHGIFVREEDNHIFVCSRADVVNNVVILKVEHYDYSGKKIQTISFKLPEEQLPIKEDTPRLVSVDKTSMFYFYAGETERQGGTLFVYSLDGKLQTTTSLKKTDVNGFPLI